MAGGCSAGLMTMIVKGAIYKYMTIASIALLLLGLVLAIRVSLEFSPVEYCRRDFLQRERSTAGREFRFMCYVVFFGRFHVHGTFHCPPGMDVYISLDPSTQGPK
jgi:hypothetical protein